MEFKQLESYIAIVKYKNLTTAAEALGISQPTISIHLKNLEEELHTRLIIRTAKNFEVTQRGQEFFYMRPEYPEASGRSGKQLERQGGGDYPHGSFYHSFRLYFAGGTACFWKRT